MVNNPEPKVNFSENDLIRLQKVQDRLDNYIKEIDIHAKRLAHVETLCNEKEKEKEYLEDQSITLKQNIESAKEIFSTLDKEIKTKKDILTELEKTSKEVHDRLFFHEDKLKEREADLLKKEIEHEKKSKDLSKSMEEHENKKKLVDKAHKTLQDTVNSLTW